PNGVPLNGQEITRNAGAKFFLPNENEWYKAAYYNPSTGRYFQYGTSSDDSPSRALPPGDTNSANLSNAVGGSTDVGAYISTLSPFGLFDMAGNVWQWNEALISFPVENDRGIRCGGFNDGTSISPISGFRKSQDPDRLSIDVGFRIAGVPEPSG